MDWRRRLATLGRRPLVLVGLMLCAVGTPEVVIGHRKASEYRRARTELPARPATRDPTQLYPRRSADDEKHAIVEAKIGYYDLLHSAGRILILLGVGLAVLGIVRDSSRRTVAEAKPASTS